MADIDMRKLIVTMIMFIMFVLVVVQADNSPPLPFNDDPPIDTQALLPYDPYTPDPFMPPYVGIPRNRYCTSKCAAKCWKQRRNRFAYLKCTSFCNARCIRPMSNAVYDCTENCVDSKSPNFNPVVADARNLHNFMNSCYVDCKNNN